MNIEVTWIEKALNFIWLVLIPFIWNLRGKVDRLLTKDEADSKFVRSEDLKRTIKDAFSEFAKDSLELDSKYVTTHQLAYREEKMVKELSAMFADEIRRLERTIAQSSIQLSTLPEKVTDLDKTIHTLDITLKSLQKSLDFVADQLDDTGDVIESNKQELSDKLENSNKELSDKIHNLELNCARRNHV